ncbi:MAG: class I SAM-dependent methyltransferase [bacterium]
MRLKEYIPNFTNKEIQDNHTRFIERVEIYRQNGLDHNKSRGFILEKAAPLKGRILELGTGIGYTTLTLAKAGYEVTAVDSDEEMLRITALNLAYERLLTKVRLFIMDAASLIFDSHSFDNVMAVALFHHLANVDRVLFEMDRVLKEKGKIIIADFNEKGMELIRAVHKEESREHQDLGVGREKVLSYLSGLGYEIKDYADEFQWVLIGVKGV